MDYINELIKTHERNILLLKQVDGGYRKLSQQSYTSGACNYKRTDEDRARLPRTIANLQQQIDELKRGVKPVQRGYAQARHRYCFE